MQLKILRSLDELVSLEQEWSQLPIPSPMQSHPWVTSWWEVYGHQQQSLYIVAARSENQLVGLAPMYLDAQSNLRWLADGQVCSDHTSLLAARGSSQEFASQFASLLMESSANDWRKLVLDSTDTEALEAQALLAALSQRGGILTDRTEPGSCYIDLPNSWEEYLASISKNHRKRCRRWLKEFFHSGRASVEVATTPSACLTAWQTLVNLHNARRNKLGESGAFENEQFNEFHRRVIPKLAAVGMIQLRILSVNGQTVAAEYLLRHNNTWFAYQSGLSSAGEAISAGNLSILSFIHEAISERCDRVDLLRGVEPYKFSWGAVQSPASTITLRRPTITGRLATLHDSVWALAREAKRFKTTKRPLGKTS